LIGRGVYDDVADVPLNKVEHANVTTIEQAEAKKGC
jgi:hypothetical protein